MKKQLLLLATFGFLVVTTFGQQSETRELPSFSKISIESISKVYIKQEPTQSVNVSTDDVLRDVETSVRNQTLYINGLASSEIHISIPTIERLSIEGKGEILGESPLRSDRLNLEISGDGKINVEVDANDLNAKISGLGKIELKGTAKNTNISISGSGKIEADDLKTIDCKASISGLGKCTIDVTDNLTTEISGSGSVTYKNTPKSINKSISGIGKISGLNETDHTVDTTRMNFGDSEILVISKNKTKPYHHKPKTKPVWQGFEMGINTYVDSKGNFDVPPGYEFLELRIEKSISVGLNLLQKNIQLGHSNVWFFTGFGISWNNYRFDNNVTLQATTPISATIDTTSNKDHIKSKLTCIYLTVPVMFEAFTSRDPKKAFHIGVGGLLGIRSITHTKEKYEIDGDVFKPKVFNDFGLVPFRYGMRAAVGFHRLNVYADYYFSPLFKSGRGPSLYPVNFGITLIGI